MSKAAPENVSWLRQTFIDIAKLLGYKLEMTATVTDIKTRERWTIKT